LSKFQETAESFMLSHTCIELGIVFRTTDTLFADTCKIAMNLGKEWSLKPDWNKVLLKPKMIRKNNRYYVRSKKGEKK